MSASRWTPPRSAGRGPYWIALGVFAIGVAVTAALAIISAAQYRHNESRLLQVRGRELGAVLSETLGATQTPLASAAALAEATNGNLPKFRRFIASYVPSQYQSVSLWEADAPQRGPLVVVGARPELLSPGENPRALFARASRNHTLTVVGLRSPQLTRIGYALVTPQSGRFAVYAERAVPADRQSRYRSNTAFSDLDYVIYLGRTRSTANVLVTSLKHLPVRGRQTVVRVPYGDIILTLVVAPHQPLEGGLPRSLPYIIAVVGVLLALGAATLIGRLGLRRRAAEHLADRLEHAVEENQRLYAEQRSIAQTLQHALLPDTLEPISGAQTSARYEPGQRDVDIGGDWYDLLRLRNGRVLLVVGDVSGRGVAAATTMAALRYAIHAYAAETGAPDLILRKLSGLLNLKTDRHFATVLCASIDVARHEIIVASAGHLPSLLVSDGHASYLESPVGVPIGVEGGAEYTPHTVIAPPGATLIAYTDGLVERRGETLDTGLSRLSAAATGDGEPLDALVDRLLVEVRPPASVDDTAIVALRWDD